MKNTRPAPTLHSPRAPHGLANATGDVVVTGASGNVGGGAVAALRGAGVPVRAVGTKPSVLAARYPGARTELLDLHRPETFGRAVAGAAALVLVRPPAITRVGPTLNALVDEARRAGVGHVVFVSVAGAEANRLIPHHRVERHLTTAGIPWTVLRPGFFAQNLADAYAADIVRDDRVHVPAGRGRVAFIDTRDIGAAIATVLAEPSRHAGAAYTLTGPQAVTFDDVADLLTAELGRQVRYEPASAAGYLAHVCRSGRTLTQALVQTVLHVGLRRGDAETVDPALAALLGRPPRDLAEYVRDHRSRWLPDAAPEGVRR